MTISKNEAASINNAAHRMAKRVGKVFVPDLALPTQDVGEDGVEAVAWRWCAFTRKGSQLPWIYGDKRPTWLEGNGETYRVEPLYPASALTAMQERIDALTAENAALTAERDAAKYHAERCGRRIKNQRTQLRWWQNYAASIFRYTTTRRLFARGSWDWHRTMNFRLANVRGELDAATARANAAETSHAAARENFLTMQQAAASLLARAEAAERRVATLEAALGPFAEYAEHVSVVRPGWDHDEFDIGGVAGEHITMADFRAARAALQPKDDANGQ